VVAERLCILKEDIQEIFSDELIFQEHEKRKYVEPSRIDLDILSQSVRDATPRPPRSGAPMNGWLASTQWFWLKIVVCSPHLPQTPRFSFIAVSVTVRGCSR
jgi:hypothetical protein